MCAADVRGRSIFCGSSHARCKNCCPLFAGRASRRRSGRSCGRSARSLSTARGTASVRSARVTRESLNHAKVRPGAAVVADGGEAAEPSAKQQKVAKVAEQHKEALAECRCAACRSPQPSHHTDIETHTFALNRSGCPYAYKVTDPCPAPAPLCCAVLSAPLAWTPRRSRSWRR
eukprot:5025534-Prymnesium_polylepis.1